MTFNFNSMSPLDRLIVPTSLKYFSECDANRWMFNWSRSLLIHQKINVWLIAVDCTEISWHFNAASWNSFAIQSRTIKKTRHKNAAYLNEKTRKSSIFENKHNRLWRFVSLSNNKSRLLQEETDFVCVNNYERSIVFIMFHREHSLNNGAEWKASFKFLCFMNECLTLSVWLFWLWRLLLVATCHNDLSLVDLSIHRLSLDMMWVIKCQRDRKKWIESFCA